MGHGTMTVMLAHEVHLEFKKFQGESVFTEINNIAFIRKDIQAEVSADERRNKVLFSG